MTYFKQYSQVEETRTKTMPKKRKVRSHISWGVGEVNETFFIRVWKPLPSRCVLKTLREAQRGQYLLAVDLGCYR